MKVCKECNIEKLEMDFHKKRGRKGGISAECKSCKKTRDSLYYQKNKEAIIIRTKKYCQENRSVSRASAAKYYKNNRSEINHKKREHYRNNRSAEIMKNRIWLANGGQAIKNAYEAKRRAAKLQATPFWADVEELKRIYEECPIGCQVDHVLPLKGKTVCGLHIPINLQYLTAFENGSKGNRLLKEHTA